MGTPSTSTDRIAAALFTKTQRAVLGLLVTQDRPEYHLREIVRRSGVGQGAVQRELLRMSKAGLLLTRSVGRQVYYRANPEIPIYRELVQLTTKLMGVSQTLRTALSALNNKIRIAAIYGSYARNEAKVDSDVDLLIIGQVMLRELASILKDLQNTIGREINPTVFPPAEYREKLQAGHHFLSSLQKEPLIYLIGNADELKSLG